MTPEELVAAWADGLQLLQQAEFEAVVADAVQRHRARQLEESARWN